MIAILDGKRVEINDELLNLSLYGFGVYSSFIVSEGKNVLGWNYHLERIQSDAREFLGLTVERKDIVDSVQAFVTQEKTSQNITCRITVFPGDFSLGAPHSAGSPRLLVTGRSGSSLSGKPLSLRLVDCDRPFAQYKITNIAAAMKHRGEAKAAGFDDALFTVQGKVLEGPTWNVFFIESDKFFTPPTEGHILPGVTRRMLIDILDNNVMEESISATNLSRFDGAFVTNAAIGVVPVRAIDDVTYPGDNKIIPRLQEIYQNQPRSFIS